MGANYRQGKPARSRYVVRQSAQDTLMTLKQRSGSLATAGSRRATFACRDDEGYLWIKGRTSEFIKIRGVRVSFGEVETKVAAVPGVYECAATATQHPEAGEALALFIVSDDGASTVAERVRRALPPQWTCVSVRVVPQLPKTGKRQDCPISVTDDGMSIPVEIARGIESQLAAPLYGLDPKERRDSLLALLKKELAYACDRNLRFRNYAEHWPVDFHTAHTLADLPYLPVGAFKSNPPLAFGQRQ